MGDILLVRHGETEWSRSGRHTSRTDLPLTEEGAGQATAVGPALRREPVAAVLCSPRRRALATADLAGLGGPGSPGFRVDDDLVEWEYGAYEGITTARIQEDVPEWFLFSDGAPDSADGFPGESPEQVGARVDRVLARAAAALDEGGGGNVVLVAHGHVLRALTARYLGLPASSGALFKLGTGTYGRLGTEHGRPVVMAWNVRPGD